MMYAELRALGYRWYKPTWVQTADRAWVLIIPSSLLKISEPGRLSDPQFDPCQRWYEVYQQDGTWLDQLHERQVEQMLRSPAWRSREQKILQRAP